MSFADLAEAVKTKSAKFRAGEITEAQFNDFMDRAETEARRLRAAPFRELAASGNGDRGIASKALDDDDRRLAFGETTAKAIVKAIIGEHDGVSTKGVAPAGAAVVDQEFQASPVALGRPANSLLDVLPVRAHGSPEFSYLRQNVRTNNAAVVAEGATKPTSVYSVTRVEQSLAVIAHLSEGVPRYWFLDNDLLQGFIVNELQYGLRVAVEAKVLADINATSGTQSQAYATSPLVTVRKSITKLEVAGYDPAAIVLAPSDWEGIELAVSSVNAIEHMNLPYDAASRRLYGVPVVVANVQAVGVSHVLARDAVAVNTDNQGTGVQWSENSNATDFSQNLIRARCEGRFAASVYSPLGVVVGDLTA